jgi:Uma2 family endonuclease
MSTTDRAAPPLVEGDRLDQPEFHRRYEAMPDGVRAELIGGVVYMPSPVSLQHSDSHTAAVAWQLHYAAGSSGVQVLIDATTILGFDSELQPDVQMRIRPECGGQTWDEGGYIHGAPELVVEVSKATRYVDLGPKLADYERAGVLEYVVRALGPDDVLWFRRGQGGFVRAQADPDGLYRSAAFPGLWLDPAALLAGDTTRLRQAVDLGLATPEHAAFVARLEAARRVQS